MAQTMRTSRTPRSTPRATRTPRSLPRRRQAPPPSKGQKFMSMLSSAVPSSAPAKAKNNKGKAGLALVGMGAAAALMRKKSSSGSSDTPHTTHPAS